MGVSVSRAGTCGLAVRSALHVDPGAAGPRVAEALAPGCERLARVRNPDLAVVAVDLREAVRVDVAGIAIARRRVVDLDRRRPGAAAVRRAPVPDVPGIRIVAAGGLHVPNAHVAAARRCEPRPRRILSGNRERRTGAPRPTFVG